MNINILCPGKTKQGYIKDGIKEYLKRLKLFANVQLLELPDVKLTSTNNIDIVKEKEAEIIRKRIPENCFLIALDERGEQFDSVGFANLINRTENSNIVFLTGGVYGLSSDLIKKSDIRLSFSKMTFTHQMIRLILLEQVYRAFTITAGRKYHY